MTKDEALSAKHEGATTVALKLALEALETCNWVDDGGYGHAEYDHVSTNKAITAIREALAQPEFTKHEVVSAEDWSEWVCPDPQSYLMKCCDCGLLHEAQFKVVRYKSEDEREECDPVNDPNLQAVFRMRRSEQWSPKDTAYRPGGLAQPEQEPVACVGTNGELMWLNKSKVIYSKPIPLYTTPPQRKPLSDVEIWNTYKNLWMFHPAEEPRLAGDVLKFARAIEQAHGIKE